MYKIRSLFDQSCHWDSCTQITIADDNETHDGQSMIAQAHWHVCQMNQEALFLHYYQSENYLFTFTTERFLPLHV